MPGTLIKLRRNTAAGWTSSNPVLGAGEPGFEKDTGRFKIGNGILTWNSLNYSSGVWGDISGTLADQTDLQNALNAKISSTQKGVANGVASLDSNALIPTAQLPSYVDDVLEVANFAALPGTGVTGKIYVTLDDNKVYRWTGSVYIQVNSSVLIADQLSTPRDITLTGEVTGTAAFDGTATASITATIAGQSGNNGKYLKTDGSVVSWSTVDAGATLSAAAAGQTLYPGMSLTSTGTWIDARVSTAGLYYTVDDLTLHANNFNNLSDFKLKTNIQTIPNAVDIVTALRGVSFNWVVNNAKSYGVIAQEVEEILPELVNTVSGTKSVNYLAMIGILIEAIKELKQEIKDIKDGN